MACPNGLTSTASLTAGVSCGVVIGRPRPKDSQQSSHSAHGRSGEFVRLHLKSSAGRRFSVVPVAGLPPDLLPVKYCLPDHNVVAIGARPPGCCRFAPIEHDR